MPQNREKVFTLLGFAQKSGKLHSGEDAVMGKLNKKSAALLLVAEDAPADTKGKMENAASNRGIPYLVFGAKGELGLAMGKSPRNAVLVMDKGFAASIINNIKD